MNKDQIIKQLLDMAKHPTVTLPRDCEVLRVAADLLAQPERHELQADGKHPAPCARFCEANAFQIEIRRLKAQLAQPEQEQEPVGQLLEEAYGQGQVMWFNKPDDFSMLYTTLPQRTWVGLTDDEVYKSYLVDTNMSKEKDWVLMFYEAIEAKLKEKNT